MALFTTMLVFGLLAQIMAFDMGQSTRCVLIPQHLSVCQDVGYSEMRLPNFLGDSNLDREVVPRSNDWRSLLQTGCHPQAQSFICSLIAPVCLDTFIQPCRSLCLAVRDSCASVLTCHGHSWPEELNCDRFPAQDDMCLTPLPKHIGGFSRDLPQPVCQICPPVTGLPSFKTVLDILCLSDFSVKAKLFRRLVASSEPEFEVEGNVEFIQRGPLMPYDTTNLLREWLLLNLRCAHILVKPGRAQLYLITGIMHSDGTVELTHLFPWMKRDLYISVATRKWKRFRC